MLGSLADAVRFARFADGEAVALVVADWSGVKRLFDEEGLWDEDRLEAWLSATAAPEAVIAARLEVSDATPAARALLEAEEPEDLTEAFRGAARTSKAMGAPALRGFRSGSGSPDPAVLSGPGGTSLRASLLHRPTRDAPFSVTLLQLEEAKTARRAFRQSQARYRGIVEDQTDFIVRYRADGVRTFVNRPYAAFFGGEPEDFIGSSFLSLVADEHRAAVEEKIQRLVRRDAVVLADEHLSIRHDGVARWTHWVDRAIFDDEGQLVELQAVGRDITEYKEAERRRLLLEQRLAQAQKMEALGTLAGGLAHDFNNSLTGIVAYSDLLRSHPADAPSVREYAESIRQAAERASELTRSLLQLSRRSPGRLSRCDIREIVESAGHLLRAAIERRIALRVEAQELPPVLADAGQLTQALINLGLNARDAIPARGSVEISAASEREHGHDVVVLRVRDDGVGIPEHVRSRVFEPFFTTKAEGRGTGLGLAMVYACAVAHGGRVELESEEGRGTTVELRLPLSPCPPESEPGPVELSGHETVLLVDDEPVAVLHGRQILEGCGYRVLGASGGDEAISRFGDRLDELDAVVTDLVMPAGNGRELEQWLHARRPSLPVLLMTGGLVDRGSGDFAAVLEKPLSADELLRSLRAVLDRGRLAATS